MRDDPNPSGERIASFHRSRARQILNQAGDLVAEARAEAGASELNRAFGLSRAARGELRLAEAHMAASAVPGTRGDWTGYGAEGAETATLFPADGTGRMLRLDIVPDSEGWRCICREDLKPPGWNDPAARRGHCAHRWEARVDAEAAAAAWVAP